MTSTLITSKTNSGKSANSETTTGDQTPITEEELHEKETPITINDVLRLRKATNSKRKKKKKYSFIE
jgi:hypothetical protein